MKKIALVGIFFDGYVDVWEDFLELYVQHWSDCPYPFYIVDNVLELPFAKEYPVQVIHAGADAEYSKRVQTALKEIDADYLIILLEDNWLGAHPDMDALEKAIDRMEKEQIYFYTMPCPDFVSKKDQNKVEQIPVSKEYTLECQPCIYERNFLAKCIGEENYNAWVFEGIYVKSKQAHTEEFLQHCIRDTRNILHIHHAILQSKLIKSTVDYFESQGYELKSQRERMSEADERKRNLKINLRSITPVFLRKLKRKLFANQSTLAKYDKDVESVMKKMNLE